MCKSTFKGYPVYQGTLMFFDNLGVWSYDKQN